LPAVSCDNHNRMGIKVSFLFVNTYIVCHNFAHVLFASNVQYLSYSLHSLHVTLLTLYHFQSIAESNFRYNGARLCKYFDTSLEDSKELFRLFSKELFRDLLCFQ